MTYDREDRYTTTEADAAWFEAGHAPTALEDALDRGYTEPDGPETRSTLPLTDPAPFERAVRTAREMKAEAWRREWGAGS